MKYRNFRITISARISGTLVAVQDQHDRWHRVRNIWDAMRFADQTIDMMNGDPEDFPSMSRVPETNEHRLTARELL